MIKFKDFLVEEVIPKSEYYLRRQPGPNKSQYTPNPGDKFSIKRKIRDTHNYISDKIYDYKNPHQSLFHTRTVNGHDVRVEFKNHGIKNKPTQINFMVNGHYTHENNPNLPLNDKMHVLNHVRNTINSYIDHYKPSHISMSPNIEQKSPLYSSFAKSIAKRVGGKYIDANGAKQVSF